MPGFSENFLAKRVLVLARDFGKFLKTFGSTITKEKKLGLIDFNHFRAFTDYIVSKLLTPF